MQTRASRFFFAAVVAVAVSPFVIWLDRVLGPPWSGLVVLAMVGSLSGFAAYMAIRTIHHIYRDRP